VFFAAGNRDAADEVRALLKGNRDAAGEVRVLLKECGAREIRIDDLAAEDWLAA